MAKVHFAPYSAIKYVGAKAKDFNTSLARPKPKLVKGDIIIVDKKTAFNLTHKGFGEYENVELIEFVKADKETAATILELQQKIESLENELSIARDLLIVDADEEQEVSEEKKSFLQKVLG